MARKKASASKGKTGQTTPAGAQEKPFPVVALGASAGGLEAFTAFLKALPPDSGMAYVLVHHADSQHKSPMAKLLARHTKMPVAIAENAMPVAPDHVYVIPPNRYIEIEKGVLRLSEPEGGRGARLAINRFLMSLAADQGRNAVAVILSGTGTDGSAAIGEIKAQGGIVLVQDPAEAQQDGMPRSAIATGAADHVVPIAQMPGIIAGFARHAFVASTAPKVAFGENARPSLAGIVATLKAHSPINFDLYKEGTLLRRIERRMVLRHMQDPVDYHALLMDSPEEVENLCRDLLISVTSFFRDAEAYACLAESVLSDLVAARQAGQAVRVWVPGCATGEEAYSLAMLLIERVSTLRKDIRIQVFATDVDERALETARAGLYPDSIEADVSQQRLDRFFVKEDHSYRVTRELRDAVVFARHDVLADAPFSRLDMISCRNLLIYLTAEAQTRIMDVFHFALNDGGVLFLGMSESVGEGEMLFQPLSRKHRIFKRVGPTRARHLSLPASPGDRLRAAASPHAMPPLPGGSRLADLSQRLLVEQYAPAAVLVNASVEALYLHGATDPYIKVAAGEASCDLLAMAREGLRARLASVLRAARETDAVARSSARMMRGASSVTVDIAVHPIVLEGDRLFLVTFQDQAEPSPDMTAPPQEGAAQEGAATHLLEQELEKTRSDLQSTIRDYERLAEELKASNEEAMSMNEKFQRETLAAQRLTENIVDTVRDPLMALDSDLNVLRANRSFHQLFGTTDRDVIGKSFLAMAGGQWDGPELRRHLERVRSEAIPVDAFSLTIEIAGKGRTDLVLSARTLADGDGAADPILVTLEDVTEQKQARQSLRDREARLHAIMDAVPEAIVTINTEGIVTSYSPPSAVILGYTQSEVMGNNVNILMPEPHRHQHDDYISAYLSTGIARIIGIGRELEASHKSGALVPIHLKVSEVTIGGERQFLGVIRDLTEEKAIRKQLQQAQKMEVIGQLAGGIAHDFNNLLTVVIGNLELLEMRRDHPSREDILNEALEAANLGAALVAKMLLLSNKRNLTPVQLDLRHVVEALRPILERTLGEQIVFRADVDGDVDPVMADPGQVESAILNLAINARDAMPKGGRLTIRAHNAKVDARRQTQDHADLAPGDYVVLSVSDTGSGMSPDVMERAFEPFFTTKEPGKGTGLGLPMLYGWARQSGGALTLRSTPGEGTDVRLYLPAIEAGAGALPNEAAGQGAVGAPKGETVLLVEDDPKVRNLTRQRLEVLGYPVIEAENGPAALTQLEKRQDIRLMLSDIVMPGGIDGFELANKASALYPDLGIILTTGFAPKTDDATWPVLRKPYSIDTLSKALRAVLDNPA